MRNFFLGALAAIVLPVALLIFVLLVAPNFRHHAFRAVIEVPGVATYFLMRQQLIFRKFGEVNRLLIRQLNIGNELFSGSNMMVPSLLKNSDLAIERARFPEEFAALRPFLLHLTKSQPELLPARLWLARALADEDPEGALKQLEIAVKLASADERGTR